MNEISDWTLIGKSVPRREDAYLLRGQGKYLDDLPVPQNTMHLGFVCSPYAHAKIAGVDASRAKALPGVIDVLTGADFSDDILPFAPDIQIDGYRRVERLGIAV
ncbi:MAG TPA: hypothetical protein DG761_08085, partial [Gammaproteobacteria bacterium]|nr:hypothetical protein [Gammaproteobacteria bacterium]